MAFISGIKSVQQVDILPYHRYGAGKYARLGLDCPLDGLEEYTEEALAEITEQISAFGIQTTIGG